MNISDKITNATIAKTNGNNEFKNKNIKQALRYYHECILYVKGLDNGSLSALIPTQDIDTSIKNNIKDLMKSCYLNMSACYLKLNQFQKTIEYSDKVLEINDKEAKAYFRRAQARIGLNSLEKAELDFKIAASYAPQDIGIRTELTAVRQRIADLSKKSSEYLKEGLKNM